MTEKLVLNFIRESNKIEGIDREPLPKEIEEFYRFIALDKVTIHEMIAFVRVYQPGAALRLLLGDNVRVGNHYPPEGGPRIADSLRNLLFLANDGADPYDVHREYETLHPFLDCNGRSGRMLWAWQMVKKKRGLDRAFLHQWYYDSLQVGR
jgi:hypothetical protein